MPSTKEYLSFISEGLSGLEDVSYRAMMGEYIIYFRGVIMGGIYDNRLLVKVTKAAKETMPQGRCELPYEGAKPMLLVENPEDMELLRELFNKMYEELSINNKK